MQTQMRVLTPSEGVTKKTRPQASSNESLVASVAPLALRTSAAGGNETDLATSGHVTSNGRRLTDMLMVTTTVGMFNGIHGHTTDLRPAVALDLKKTKEGTTRN